MEKLLRLSLKIFLLLSLISCDLKLSTKEEKVKYAEKRWEEFLKHNGYRQGSPVNMREIEGILKLNPNHCEAQRELSVP